MCGVADGESSGDDGGEPGGGMPEDAGQEAATLVYGQLSLFAVVFTKVAVNLGLVDTEPWGT